MKRVYNNPEQQRVYETLRKLGTPQVVSDAGIWGSVLAAFRNGFNGVPRPAYLVRGTLVWAAFYAGKDAADANDWTKDDNNSDCWEVAR